MSVSDGEQKILNDVVCDDIEYQLIEWSNNGRNKKVSLSIDFLTTLNVDNNEYLKILIQNIRSMHSKHTVTNVFQDIKTFEMLSSNNTKKIINRYCEVFGINTVKLNIV